MRLKKNRILSLSKTNFKFVDILKQSKSNQIVRDVLLWNGVVTDRLLELVKLITC